MMGGRGGASTLGQATKAAREYRENQRREIEERREREAEHVVKTSKSQQAIVEYVSEQTNVDLNKYRNSFTERFEDEREVLVYWKDVPNTVKNEIESLTAKGRLVTEDFGAWGKVIGLKRKKR